MRPLLLSLLLLFTARIVSAQSCNLTMTVTCTGGAHGAAGRCTATTRNAGATSCAGDYFVGFFSEAPQTQVKFGGLTNSAGIDSDCFDSGEFGDLIPNAFVFCSGHASLAPNSTFTTSTNVTTTGGALSRVGVLGFTFVADAATGDERGSAFAQADFNLPTCTPSITAPPVAQSDASYTVSWSEVSDPLATFIVEESTSADFSANLVSQNVGTARSATFRHTASVNTTYYYRVRAATCGGQPGPNSGTARVAIQTVPPPAARNGEAVAPFGSTTPVRIPIFIAAPAGGKDAFETEFIAKSDKPYISVQPSSGVIPPGGLTLNAIVDPKELPPGASTGTVSVTTTAGASLGKVPVTVSLVTPVTPGGKNTPSPNTLLIPVVTHVNGASAQFLSDVRVTNADLSPTKYRVTFTPTRSDATKDGRVTEVTAQPGQTIALNDIAKNFFGFGLGDPNEVGFGSLEIRPVETSSLLTFASSRTYASTPTGTFGQFVAAIPVAELATTLTSSVPLPGQQPETTATVLSLQQVAQSAKFRTNLGIVEGSGTPASGMIRILDNRGTVLRSVPFNLMPGEHQQLDRFIAQQGVTLEDGRIEIEISSETGAVTAYASVLDNITTDPLAVMPVDFASIRASRYVLPGVADFESVASNFHSDVRVFNGGNQPVTVTPTFYPRGNAPARAAAPFTLQPREVRAFDNVLPSVFNSTGTGGLLVFTTNGESSLVTTGRTYSIAPNGGTFGQFIPGVTSTSGVGRGDRALQILQLEQSPNFRSNIGVVELTGNPVEVRLTLTLPDSRVSSTLDVTLQPNEFRQLDRLLESLNPGVDTFNARIAVEVTAGTGRVTAYGSVIDNATVDPTYVPAQ